MSCSQARKERRKVERNYYKAKAIWNKLMRQPTLLVKRQYQEWETRLRFSQEYREYFIDELGKVLGLPHGWAKGTVRTALLVMDMNEVIQMMCSAMVEQSGDIEHFAESVCTYFEWEHRLFEEWKGRYLSLKEVNGSEQTAVAG